MPHKPLSRRRPYLGYPRHAWNLVRDGERVILVDVTHPNVKHPFMVFGTTEEEVYERAREHSREYDPTPDEQNNYGSPVVSGDLICVGGHGLWTLPRLWKTPETPGERGV